MTASDRVSALVAALRARREPSAAPDAAALAALETSLLAEIDAFDPERARQQLAVPPASAPLPAPGVAVSTPAPAVPVAPVKPVAADVAPVEPAAPVVSGGLLAQLRQQAVAQQQAAASAAANQAEKSDLLEQAMQRIFTYLHDLTQQLNIIRPPVQRSYLLTDGLSFSGLAWSEGFADYRRQSEQAGGRIERVTLSARLSGAPDLVCEREFLLAERLRLQLHDLGLQVTTQEYRNARQQVERLRLSIRGEIPLAVVWRLEVARGEIVLETRNLERLGRAPLVLTPAAVDAALLDEFGRLLLGQANRFRELARRR